MYRWFCAPPPPPPPSPPRTQFLLVGFLYFILLCLSLCLLPYSLLRTPSSSITLEFHDKQFQACERRQKDTLKFKLLLCVHIWVGGVMFCAKGHVWRAEDCSVESALWFPLCKGSRDRASVTRLEGESTLTQWTNLPLLYIFFLIVKRVLTDIFYSLKLAEPMGSERQSEDTWAGPLVSTFLMSMAKVHGAQPSGRKMSSAGVCE